MIDGKTVEEKLKGDVSAYISGYADGYRIAKRELIKCEDCKYWAWRVSTYHDDKAFHTQYAWCAFFNKSDDYCSRAEREE